MAGRPKGSLTKSKWKSTAEAAEFLGIGQRQLLRLKAKGDLSIGFHYLDIGTGSRCSYRWHIKRVERTLSLPSDSPERGRS
jgi:hypothetical protein